MQNLQNLMSMSKLWTKEELIPSESFTLQATSGSWLSPNDVATYYIGQWIAGATLAADQARIYIPKKSILKKAFVVIRLTGTLWTTEQSTMSILVNGITSYTVTSSLTVSSAVQNFNNTALNSWAWIRLNEWDYICLKWDTPTRATNPTWAIVTCVLWFDCVPTATTWFYVLQWGQIAAATPTASTTSFIAESDLTGSNTKIFIPTTWVLTACYLYVRCSTNSSSETFTYYIRKNNSSDTIITSSAKLDATSNFFSNTWLSVAVTEGDYINIKAVWPAWTTAPTSIVHRFIFVIQR